ncbi:hypothetical protein [Streptomyces sp. NPDC057509]
MPTLVRARARPSDRRDSHVRALIAARAVAAAGRPPADPAP